MWGGLIDVDALTINASTPTALVVDDATNPKLLYADFIYDTVSGTRTLDESSGADEWDPNFVVNVQDTTLNLTSYFSNRNIKGVRSGAEFTIPDVTAFSVSDSTSGASIGTATRISQTAGMIALSNGQTIQASPATITANDGDDITYIVNGSDATIGSLNTNTSGKALDIFTVTKDGNTATYTRNGVGLVTNDDRIWTSSNAVNDSVTVAELLKEDNWTNTVYITTSNVLETPPQVRSTLTSPWIILSNDKEVRYGTLTKTKSGYSITYDKDKDTKWDSSNTISVSTSPVKIDDAFIGARISGVQSKAAFSVSKTTDDFTVTDSETGAIISSNATEINQTAGLILPAENQSIVAGGYTFAWKKNDAAAIRVSVSGGDALIDGLDLRQTLLARTISRRIEFPLPWAIPLSALPIRRPIALPSTMMVQFPSWRQMSLWTRARLVSLPNKPLRRITQHCIGSQAQSLLHMTELVA